MAELERNYARAETAGRAPVGVIDEGLRAYMFGVYNYMALGVAGTALVTLFLMNNPALMMTLVGGPMIWVVFAAILALGFFSPRLIFARNQMLAHLCFWTYASLWGLLIAPMILRFFQVGAGDLVFRAFAIAAVTFAATSLYGYVTRKDLSAFSTFFIMGAIGLLVAIIVNIIFFQSTLFSFVTSGMVVLLFAGITAWETQRIKEMYYAGDGAETTRAKSIFGAFMLYGSFIVMFIHILNILGIMRDE